MAALPLLAMRALLPRPLREKLLQKSSSAKFSSLRALPGRLLPPASQRPWRWPPVPSWQALRLCWRSRPWHRLYLGRRRRLVSRLPLPTLSPAPLMLLPPVPPRQFLFARFGRLCRARLRIDRDVLRAASIPIYVLPLSAAVQVLPLRQGTERFAVENLSRRRHLEPASSRIDDRMRADAASMSPYARSIKKCGR